MNCRLPSLHAKHCCTQVRQSFICEFRTWLNDRVVELTSNLSLFDGRVILVVLAHFPAVCIGEGLARGAGGMSGMGRDRGDGRERDWGDGDRRRRENGTHVGGLAGQHAGPL